MSKTTFRKKFLDLIMTERNFKEAFPENVDVSEIPISIKKQVKEAFNLPTDDCDIILKLYEENEQIQQKWLESEYEKAKLVSQIEKMKCSKNCQTWNEWQCPYARNKEKNYVYPNKNNCPCDKWELAK